MVSEGQRIELVHTPDPHTSLNPGDRGTVKGTSTVPAEVKGREETQIWVDWDNGSNLALVESQDQYKIVDDDSDQE